MILGVSGASMPYSRTVSFVFSGVVTWIVSPSETLVTVPVTERIGSVLCFAEAEYVNDMTKKKMTVKRVIPERFHGSIPSKKKYAFIYIT